MNIKLLDYIDNSFLKDLLNNSNITDISYNGKNIYYQDNTRGRIKSDIFVSDKEAYDFVRQIANLSDSLFSFSNPILDISCGRYRINATHYSVSRKEREKVINFSIRIGYEKLRIQDDGSFIPKRCLYLIDEFLRNKESIIISGVTSSGKTEMQKFLLSRFTKNTRILIIDNVDELETDFLLKDVDSQTWLLNDGINIKYDDLIKNALRVNPDWMIVSEARGEEMLSLLNSAMTGHPTISTIHSKNIRFDYSRMTRMCMLKNPNLRFDETLVDIYDHFKLLIHTKKRIEENGNIVRYVDEIGTNCEGNYYCLYKFPSTFNELPYEFKDELNMADADFNELKGKFLNG